MVNLFVADVSRLDDVLTVILGGKPSAEQIVVASGAGVGLVVSDPAEQLTLVVKEHEQAEGVLLLGLDVQQAAAMDYYQRCFGRQPTEINVTSATAGLVRATAYVLKAEMGPHKVLTRPAAWLSEWGGHGLRMAGELMAYRGAYAPEALPHTLYAMRKRADAWVRSQQSAPNPEFDLATDVIVHRHKFPYVNYFAMQEIDFQHRRFDGSMSEVINRGCNVVGRASVVLPYDPDRDAVLLVQQFRAPVYMIGDQDPWIWEPPAGIIDPGETPEEAAVREAREEAGLEITRLDLAGDLYSSSGALAEKVYCFVGLADVSRLQGGGGVPGEGEDIRSKVISFQELMEGVDNHTFKDMPLVTTALWLARHRDRLRAGAS